MCTHRYAQTLAMYIHNMHLHKTQTARETQCPRLQLYNPSGVLYSLISIYTHTPQIALSLSWPPSPTHIFFRPLLWLYSPANCARRGATLCNLQPRCTTEFSFHFHERNYTRIIAPARRGVTAPGDGRSSAPVRQAAERAADAAMLHRRAWYAAASPLFAAHIAPCRARPPAQSICELSTCWTGRQSQPPLCNETPGRASIVQPRTRIYRAPAE